MVTCERIPFVPAMYEYLARIIGAPVSSVCRDGDLLFRAVQAARLEFQVDALTAGLDVYNVEAEAFGAEVIFPEDPALVPDIRTPLLHGLSDIARLAVPDPARAGRMPLFVEAARRLQQAMPDIVVRGAVSGPYSIAARLLGAQELVFAQHDDPEAVAELLRICAGATVAYASAFLQAGAEVILFDSSATPRVAGLAAFREVIAPLYAGTVVPRLKAAGGRRFPLIIGGDTTRVLPELLATGAPQLLCDAAVPDKLAFCRACAEAGTAVRANLSAVDVLNGPPEAVFQRAKQMLALLGHLPGLLLGCGVLDYRTPPDNIHAIRRAIESWSASCESPP